jgi:hypothetical protein
MTYLLLAHPRPPGSAVFDSLLLICAARDTDTKEWAG